MLVLTDGIETLVYADFEVAPLVLGRVHVDGDSGGAVEVPTGVAILNAAVFLLAESVERDLGLDLITSID